MPELLVADRAEALRLREVGRFNQPVYVTAAPGDARRLFVAERHGRIRVLRNGRRMRRPFLDIRRLVELRLPRNHFRDQGGLLSMAFPPDYRRTRRVYVLYTHRDGNIHLDEFGRSARSPNRASPSTRRTLLSVRRLSMIDIGGHLDFGPDGLLYASLGFANDLDSSQDLGSLTGKLLRIEPTPSGPQPYRVPEDNPFVLRAGARPEVFAYGLRVPWRFSFDRRTGDLALADVGEDSFEEVNLLPRSQGAGANLGWPLYEGGRRRSRSGAERLVFPPLTRPHGRDVCAIVGGYVVRTRRLRRLFGRYLYGDVCTGQLRSARLRLPRVTSDRSERAVVPYLVSFGRGTGERLYAVSLDGAVYRISG